VESMMWKNKFWERCSTNPVEMKNEE
jgi:hypothetical protein